MNHCLIEVRVKQAPTIRYTQDNKIPLAEMEVIFDGLRVDDQPGQIKVVGWGNMAQELQNNIQVDQRLIVEGRLRMNTISRQDGTKEKKAEITLSKFHLLPNQKQPSLNQSKNTGIGNSQEMQFPNKNQSNMTPSDNFNKKQDELSWDSSPLVPDTDEIPF